MKKSNKAKNSRFLWLLAGGAAVLIALLALPALGGNGQTPAAPTQTAPTVNAAQPLPTEPPGIGIGQGLVIERIGGYSGRYMEDGSNDIVQDVLMLILCNEADRDLQLARIRIEYPDFTAELEVTNLAAGERAVLLERNRCAYTQDAYLNITAGNVVFFPEKMDLMPDVLELGGKAGVVEATNVSGTDLAGPIYIYYKNSAGDLLYGGITYRVLIEGGIPAGETVRIPAGHYAPEDCRFVMVTTAG